MAKSQTFKSSQRGLTLKSFADLHAHLNGGFKPSKPVPGAMLVSFTCTFQAALVRKEDVRLVRPMACVSTARKDGRIERVRIKRGHASKYVVGNTDGSYTFTGRKMISDVASQLHLR